VICPECGKKLPDDAGFCVRCGANQNNPNAEVYKKTKSVQQKKNDDDGHTRIMNIIPENIQSENDESDDDTVIAEESPKRKTPKKDYENKIQEPDSDDEDDEEDEEEEEETGKSSKLAVLSVICVCLLAACIIIYFFTNHKIGGLFGGSSDSSSDTDITEPVQTVAETTAEEIVTTVETTPSAQTEIVSDNDGNLHTVELMPDSEAVVNVDDGSLRLRQYPSTDSAILGEISNGEKIIVKGVSGEWYFISQGDREGYVFSEYVSIEASDENVSETQLPDSLSDSSEQSSENADDTLISSDDMTE